MSSLIDPRIVQVGIEINGETLLFEHLDIRASGTKFLSATQSQATIQIYNLTKEHRNYILSKATPLNSPDHQRQAINITLDVGRESYGTFRLFEGAAYAFGATQPPDIGITLDGLTNNTGMSLIQATSFAATVPLRTIAQKIADQNGLALDYRAKTNKNIANYSYTGPVAKQVQKLGEMGDIIAFVDGRTLIVVDTNPQQDGAEILIDQNSGMVGVPQPTMQGVMVKTLVNSQLKLGTKINLQSMINPSVNGTYTIWSQNFEIANRAEPFWYNMLCVNNAYLRGTAGT